MYYTYLPHGIVALGVTSLVGDGSGNQQICNAGFLVPPKFRGLGIATALGQSYVVNAPLLGYKASVFNLVYVNNVASVSQLPAVRVNDTPVQALIAHCFFQVIERGSGMIWERLGFLRVGRIPFAGRLKRKEDEGSGGGGEEYVDAWVIYKSFVEDSVYTTEFAG
ncbi:hypothetical protein Clacol_002679 [Clathrus columnatus]|uniref:N-acetyltransferase domain-containing protein n=1 Tax=Clathrus columnatus TaxID=1419009 RepID=A0AAV5A1D2_9AGAM|nr:hypothetical protein Clacol_002679 [Clathrus columnatus]